MFSEERSIYSSNRGLGAGNDEGGRAVGLKRTRALLCCLEVLMFCSGNNLAFSPKRGNRYGQEGVLVELNIHRGVFPCIFTPKRGTVKNHATFNVDCPYGMFFRCAPFWRKNRGVYPFLAKPPKKNSRGLLHFTSKLVRQLRSDFW